MIEIDPSSCRICLEDAAIYPIFENNEEYESIYAKLPMCIREKLADIDGYPRRICLKCKNTSDTICAFINKYEETCKILESKVVKVKLENFDVDDNDDFDDRDSFIFELKLEKPSSPLPSDQIAEKKDPAQLLESLKHLTVKRIKAENELEESAPVQVHENAKKKKGQPKKGTKALSAKSSVKKKNSLENEKQATLKKLKEKVAAAEKNGVSKGASKSQAKTETNIQNEKVVRLGKIKELIQQKEEKMKRMESREKKIFPVKSAVGTPRLCDLCGATFKTADRLSYHRRHTHVERNYKCTKCTQAFLTEHFLTKHIKKMHENVTNVVCDLCGKGFFSKTELRSHVITVHLKKKKYKIYKCEFCDKTFKYKKGVIIHERSAHTGERPSTCEVCGSSFLDDVYLAEHMRLHTGEKPYKCPICGSGYAQRGNMKSHMRNHRISDLAPDMLAKIKPSFLKFMRP